jgi:hypothetical protein
VTAFKVLSHSHGIKCLKDDRSKYNNVKRTNIFCNFTAKGVCGLYVEGVFNVTWLVIKLPNTKFYVSKLISRQLINSLTF